MTAPHPVEIELKLALPPQQTARFLALMARRRAAPVRHELATRYFDTPDFALSARGVALRVRRIGRRWLQTLKTEGERRGGLSQRLEYEMPVSRGAPDWSRFPPEALALVPAAARAQLAPVFETRFTRTAWLIVRRGGAQIEVALDVGEVKAGKRRQPICEIELELKAGQPDALFDLALGWARQLDCVPLDASKAERGVRLARVESAAPVKSAPLALSGDMSVEDGFAAICQACLAQFQANLPGVLESGNIEYVHQARVALRRLRAALRLFRRVCVLPDDLMDGLRALAAALGPARDCDVLCFDTLPAIAPHYPDAADWQRGMAVLEAHRAGVRLAMQAALLQARPGEWLLTMQRWLLQRGWRLSPSGRLSPPGGLSPSGRAAPEAQRFVQLSALDKWARRALQKGHRPIVRGARAFAQLQPAQRHALRIAIKRQRYATEFFQTLFDGSGKDACPRRGDKRRQARYLTVLGDAQDSLGRANDVHVASGLLTAEQLDTGPMGPFVLGWLAASLAGTGTDESAKQLQNFMKSPPCW